MPKLTEHERAGRDGTPELYGSAFELDILNVLSPKSALVTRARPGLQYRTLQYRGLLPFIHTVPGVCEYHMQQLRSKSNRVFQTFSARCMSHCVTL